MGSRPSTLNAELPGRTSTSLLSLRPSATIALRLAIPAFAFLLPLIVWPGLAEPFSSPKLIAWCVATLLVGGASLMNAPTRLSQASATSVIPLSLLLACIGISTGIGAAADLASLMLLFTGIAWFVLLRSANLESRHLFAALAASASVVAAIALFQFAGMDPYRAAGWAAVGGSDARMRIYATLGNPNFVGAFLAGVLPLTIARAREAAGKRWFALAALLQGLAVVSTGSRAAALGAALGCAVVLSRSAKSRRWLGPALLVVAVLAVGFSSARPLGETLDGRLYVWRVSLPYLLSTPIFGYGPGAFEGKFDLWQQQHFLSAQNTADARFAAPFDHAHTDILEWTVQYGWAGLASLLLCAALFIAAAWRAGRASPTARAALGGVCALGLISLVDFPIHRPTELFLLVTLMAMCLASGEARQKTES